MGLTNMPGTLTTNGVVALAVAPLAVSVAVARMFSVNAVVAVANGRVAVLFEQKLTFLKGVVNQYITIFSLPNIAHYQSVIKNASQAFSICRIPLLFSAGISV